MVNQVMRAALATETRTLNSHIWHIEQGRIMTKSIFIIILCFIQGACASTDRVAYTNQARGLSQQIAAEISVRHESLEATVDVETITAQNEFAAN
jgi:hypothetical protein